MSFLDTYRNRKVFVTGHTGFKGAWLTFLLTELGAEVCGYALPPVGDESLFGQLGLADKIRHHVGDIRDAAEVARVMTAFEPDFVFHLAAQALVRPSYDDPLTTFSTNVMGSANVLDAVRKTPSVRSLVYITSDKCYENVEWVWGYRETDQLGGADPYSASKAAAELVFSSYCRSYLNQRTTLGAASVRAGNVIGGGDWAVDRIVPDCIRAIRGGVPILLRNPGATRPWQHVLEPISGYLNVGARLFEEGQRWNGAWNFGPDSQQVRTVKAVADRIVASLGSGSVEVAEQAGAVHEARLLQLNCDKAAQMLGWSARWSVDQAIDATADWYAATLRGEEPVAKTRQQIADYFGGLL
jgi:CDP-glucose 4,6-dehydratase